MKITVQFLQLVISVMLIGLVLLQAKGVGLGRAWGGAGDFYKSRRGVEKIVFYFTIAVVIIFFATSILSLLYS